MTKDHIKQAAVISLFWGALWGIAEATIGYLAHLAVFLPGIAGFIMFPIGFYMMTRAYKENGKPGVILSTAAVAASIKLVDLFLPGLSPIHTINPAISILMESAVVFLAYKLMQKQTASFRLRELMMVSGAWRMGFLLYSVLLFVFSVSGEFIQMGAVHILRFMLLETVVNALIIMVFFKWGEVFNSKKARAFRAQPALAAAAFTAAVLIKLVLANL